MSSGISSIAATTSRATQYTVLNESLEKLQRNLEVLKDTVEDTVVQAEWMKRLMTIHSSLLMASSRTLKEETDIQGQGRENQETS
ncbi:hypothetical protein BX616_000426 [Lobosporangium transversale]|uniref:Uncharacterized protein n=1 Tax=Lobosporangium transversale TaxID=64571 RepID=A0A1Y2GP08_9FUNG|nr:hypothetical protein BCR41DRAFT_352507 [Lobosporangium transversale]KAF9907378.1 hypothetical protein BX616_000426 [Lobosporangium transversale]ORZ17439.1 hypothetical protein BCR41DRAFT_352507 [Lobosporangium transversale]|eukprot:XP_021881826.1 hypothetical protein BCR41DRAFT_352507 [Lobosporangium transversale]